MLIFQGRKMRLDFLDLLRGIAVFSMVIYHFFWDLGFFGYIDISLVTSGLGLASAQIIGSTFILISGFSLSIFRSTKNNERKFWMRFLKLFVLSLVISFVTKIFDPRNFIFFGILHLLTFCSLVGFIILRQKKPYLLFLLLFMSFSASVINLQFDLPYYLAWIGLNVSVPNSGDFYPILPWIIFYLIGLWLGKFVYKVNEKRFKNFYQKSLKKRGLLYNSLLFSGRNSLIIYILHQPVFFSLFLLLNRILSNEI